MNLAYNLLWVKNIKNQIAHMAPDSTDNELRVIVVKKISSKAKSRGSNF